MRSFELRLFGREIVYVACDTTTTSDILMGRALDKLAPDEAQDDRWEGAAMTGAAIERDARPLDPLPGEQWEEDKRRNALGFQRG